MNLKMFVLALFVASSVHAQSCPDLFTDAPTLVNWGLQTAQIEKLVDQGYQKDLQAMARVVRLLMSAPPAFYRFLSMISPYANLSLDQKRVGPNPLERDKSQILAAWTSTGLEIISLIMADINPDWHKSHLKDPSPEMMDILIYALMNVPPLKLIQGGNTEQTISQSVDRVLGQQQLGSQFYLDLVRHSRFVRLRSARYLGRRVFNLISMREPTDEEVAVLDKLSEWKLWNKAQRPSVPSRMAKEARVFIDSIDHAIKTQFRDVKASSLHDLFLNLSYQFLQDFRDESGRLQDTRLFLFGMMNYLKKDAVRSYQVYPFLFSGLMATLVQAEWPAPSDVEAAVLDGLRQQIQALSYQ